MMSCRRRLLLLAVAGLVLVSGALAAGWYVVRDERRLGHLAGGLLAGRSRLAVSVERARMEGRGLTLLGVRVEHASLPFRLTIPRLEVEGTVAPSMITDAGAVSLVATSATVSRRDIATAADRSGVDALRDQVLGLARLDGSLRLRMQDMELRGPAGTYRVDLTGEKTTTGTVALSLTLAPAGQPPALRVDARATAAGGADVDLRVDVAAEPPRLGALWPAGVPAPPSIATRGDVRLQQGGGATATGRVTMGTTVPAVLDFTARYDGATAALDVSRWALAQGDGVRLMGTVRAEPSGEGTRVASTMQGTVDDARVDGHARYEGGAVRADVRVEPLSALALWQRLGLGAPAIDARARVVRARLTGADDGPAVSVTVDASLEGIETPALAAPAEGVLGGAVRLVRGEAGLGLAGVEHAVLALVHGGVQAATITARSRGSALWPLAVEAQVPDAAVAAPLVSVATALTGSGRMAGEVEETDGALRFRGVLDVELLSAELMLGAPMTLTAVRVAGVPVHWNAGGAEQPGVVTIGRLAAHGLGVDDVTGTATLIDGLLRVPDLRYRHYDGQGSGWMEIALGSDADLVRARVEGERVDLGALVRETGSTLAQVTGRVRYTGSLQQRQGRGVDALLQLRSQERGEIGIEAIETLLASAAVEVESTGLLRQTLENLRVFEYESLDGELRVADGQGIVDLSIRGRRLLGLFPGPVQAINFRNVPLEVLGSTLDRGTSR